MSEAKTMQGLESNKKECNCRKANECPVQNKCLKESVVYQAATKRGDGVTDAYIGLNATRSNFKDKTRNPKNATALSKYIWNLEDENVTYDVSWGIVSRAKPFNHATGVCNLCTREQYFIIFNPDIATTNVGS